MNFNIFSPVNDIVISRLVSQSTKSLGQNIKVHSKEAGFPDLSDVTIAILGVKDGRGTPSNKGCGDELQYIREKLYSLFPGNWNTKIADLGNIIQGNTHKDTYFAVTSSVKYLLNLKIIPILVGGSQDITYANYRGYDSLEQTINLVSVDSRFDLGVVNDKLESHSFLSKIIMEQPNNLFNYSNIGYQTYLNSQEEIELLDKLYFDVFRLGEIKDITLVETIMRDADIVSIDIGAVRQSEAPANRNASPNGFYGEDICAISRYAGISDKVTSFGIYEYNSTFDINHQTASLIAQMIWFFIEGVNARIQDYPFVSKDDYQKYTVLLTDDDPINFYKSDKSGRWWMEINAISNTKNKRHTLVPCNYEDYEQALKRKMPVRWYKALQKLV